MANTRSTILATGEIYHIFNRGVERRTVFSNTREYKRSVDTIDYYRFAGLPIRYSHFLNLTYQRKQALLGMLTKYEVSILAYCLMPNHFHFVLKQEGENGISRFLSNFTNSYTKFFNTKYERVGPLFQGTFKAVRVESEEQLIHLSRYVHLNPVSSFLIPENKLNTYPWSSFPEYLNRESGHISDPNLVLSRFKNKDTYREFVHDQINYAKELKMIEHLAFDI